jgi:hypothetical protein
MVHELRYHDKACFITLTYNNENLPEDKSLDKKHFQKFMKRLRKHFEPRRISFYHCGEYGEVCSNCGDSYPVHNPRHKKYTGCTSFLKTLGRPHYHAILYGVDFSRKKTLKNGEEMEVGLKLHKKTRAGNFIYTSKELDKLWGKGFCTIGDVTFESCAYVSRYVTKKINGAKKDEHYKRMETNPETGEIIKDFQLLPEYATMSRNPAIGLRYLMEFSSDIYPHDRVVNLRNNKSYLSKPPRYYDKKFSEDNEEIFKLIKNKRIDKAERSIDNTRLRLQQREHVKKVQTKTLERNFEIYHDES